MKKLIFLYLAFMGSAMTTPFSFDEVIKMSAEKQVKEPLFLQASDGTSLAYYPFLPAQEPAEVVIFYHGGGIWSNKIYQQMAQQTCDQYGIGVYLFDVRGHGNSQGPRGDALSAKQVWKDIYAATQFVKASHPASKRFLGGHSSGAGMVLNYTKWNEKNDGIEGYIFLAPFLGARLGTSYEHADQSKNFVKDVNVLALILNAITSGWPFGHFRAFSFNYPEWLYKEDPLVLRDYTCAMAQAVSPENTDELFAKLSKPCATFIGENDEQFIPAKVIARAQSMTRCREKSVAQIIPGAKHLSILCQGPELIKRAVDTLSS